MKALVKSEAKPGIWMKDIDIPKVGHNVPQEAPVETITAVLDLMKGLPP